MTLMAQMQKEMYCLKREKKEKRKVVNIFLDIFTVIYNILSHFI